MTKILNGIGFVIATFMVVLAFLSATTYLELGAAVILYIILAIVAHKSLPTITREIIITNPPISADNTPIMPNQAQVQIPAEVLTKEESQKDESGVADFDKRSFLKLIGVAGISLFVYSILFKKGETPFFKSASIPNQIALTDSKGNKIDPSERQPMDGYKVTEVDDSVISYLGFINKDGAWVIMKQDTMTGSFRYARGENNFPDGWTRRESLAFDYFNNIF